MCDGLFNVDDYPPCREVTFRVTKAPWLRLPLVPMIVSWYCPGVVLEVGVTVRVLVPEPLGIGFLLKVAVTPVGSGSRLKVTLPAKPFDGVTVNV